MSPKTTEPTAARERILSTASDLFYRYGFQAVGIDTIVAESGVAKMTLYRHFQSKDELIAAYLERSNAKFWAWIEEAIADVESPRARILAMFEVIGKFATTGECLGCTFQGAAAEFPVLDHPTHKIVLGHKNAVKERLYGLAVAAHLCDPMVLVEQLLLLMEGAWVSARIFGPNNPSQHIAQAAAILVQAHSNPAE